MESLDLLNWGARSLSLFNTMTLLWLGLTVLLNAERRAWGTWVIGGGLLFAGLFFVGHTAVVGTGFGVLASEMEIGWRIAWMLLIIHPYLWYLAIGWYTGTLPDRRQRVWVSILSLIGLLALALMLLDSPLPTYSEIVQSSPAGIPGIGGVPVAVLAYPLYSVLCFALSLWALHQPGTSQRFMGDIARRRARPWLIGASIVLLGVCLILGGAGALFLYVIQAQSLAVFSSAVTAMLTGLDLLVSGLLAVATVLVGQAIVSYEVFTGKILPRGGLFRQWRNNLIFAAAYGAVLGGSLGLLVDPIYRLVLATVVFAVFYALFSWRSYAEREQSMAQLRPFVASHRLYDRVLGSAASLEVDAGGSFRVLCDDILNARVAFLTALGPLSPLFGPTLSHPTGMTPPMVALSDVATRFRSPQTICMPIDPAHYGGAVWAVPLWSERGLIGMLLLGEKRDGGLYAQEEIEIARGACERLVDTQASSELARRLMALQRQRLADSHVLDRSARRTLHDDVLPRLHEALLKLSNVKVDSADAVQEVAAQLADIHRRIADLMRVIPPTAAPEVARLGLIGALRHMVETESGHDFEGVTWQVESEAEDSFRTIHGLTAEVVFFAAREAIRNSGRHGRAGDATRALHLTVRASVSDEMRISIEDDGVGLDAARTSRIGSGQGLALHSTMMAVVGGTLAVESILGTGTRILLSLPSTTATGT